jgi:hypothetical protein
MAGASPRWVLPIPLYDPLLFVFFKIDILFGFYIEPFFNLKTIGGCLFPGRCKVGRRSVCGQICRRSSGRRFKTLFPHCPHHFSDGTFQPSNGSRVAGLGHFFPLGTFMNNFLMGYFSHGKSFTNL